MNWVSLSYALYILRKHANIFGMASYYSNLDRTFFPLCFVVKVLNYPLSSINIAVTVTSSSAILFDNFKSNILLYFFSKRYFNKA